MAVNSIFWKLPDNFSFYSRNLKKKIQLQAYVIEFRRLLPCESLGFQEVSNRDLLHSIVGVYDVCLPDITPEVLYSTVCGRWAKTLIFIRSLSDVLNEQQEKCKSTHNEKTDSDSSDDNSDTANLHVQEAKVPGSEKATFLTQKHVHWEDEEEILDSHEDGNNFTSEDDSVQSTNSHKTNSEQQDRDQQESNTQQSDNDTAQLKDKTEKVQKEEKKEEDKEVDDPGMFDGVFSDPEEEEESSDDDEEEEDFSTGVDDFIAAAKERKTQRDSGNVIKDTVGIESLIVGVATYERNYGKPKEKVIQLSLLAVRKKYQKCGIGKMILNTLKDPTFISPYDSIAVYADLSAVEFFKKNHFSDDIVLNSRFMDLTDHWINSKLMCYLPPFTGSDISGVHRNDYEMKAIEEEITLWKDKSLEAYQAQASCMVRMQHEIKTLRALVDTQEEAIKTLTNSRERLQKEKFRLEKKLLDLQLEQEEKAVELDLDEHDSDDEDFYDSLVTILNKQHTDGDADTDHLDLEAISKGDFGDVSKEDEELLTSLIHSQSDKHLTQLIRRSLLSTGLYNTVMVDSISKVECSHVSFLETNLDGRHAMPGHAPVVKQLFYCGDYTNGDNFADITTRGFTKKDFTSGIYGRGLYFTKQPSQAARFSPPGKLLLVNVGLGVTESVFQQDKTRTLPPAGFDSILTPGRPSSPVSPRFSNQAEYVVFDPMQAVPVYLIEYSTSKI